MQVFCSIEQKLSARCAVSYRDKRYTGIAYVSNDYTLHWQLFVTLYSYGLVSLIVGCEVLAI